MTTRDFPDFCPHADCDNHALTSFEGFKTHWRRKHLGQTRPDSVGRGFRSDLLTNSWIPLLQSWSKLPLEHPLSAQGSDILNFFKSGTFQPTLGTNIFSIFDFSPKYEHVFRDLEIGYFSNGAISGELVHTETGLHQEDLTLSHLFASVAATNANNFHHFNLDHLCAAISFEAHDEDGLEACLPHMPPEAKSLGIPSSDDGPRLEIAYTPRGHITGVHQDGFWDGSIVTVLFGRKLLITWPPTGHNLKVYFQHWPLNVIPPLDIIKELQAPTFTIMDHGHYTFIPQGTLHLVMAFDTSAMVSFGIKHPNMITKGLLLSDSVTKHLKTLPCHNNYTKDVAGQLLDGARTHCNVDDDLYANANDEADNALLWTENQLSSLT